MFNWLKQFSRTHYVGMMEAELVRLRAENRALTNSLLGTAGFPPVDYPQETNRPLSRLRKRSWPQVQARRESDAARDIETDRDKRVYGPVSHS